MFTAPFTRCFGHSFLVSKNLLVRQSSNPVINFSAKVKILKWGYQGTGVRILRFLGVGWAPSALVSLLKAPFKHPLEICLEFQALTTF